MHKLNYTLWLVIRLNHNQLTESEHYKENQNIFLIFGFSGFLSSTAPKGLAIISITNRILFREISCQAWR